jgi:hypothetical protein
VNISALEFSICGNTVLYRPKRMQHTFTVHGQSVTRTLVQATHPHMDSEYQNLVGSERFFDQNSQANSANPKDFQNCLDRHKQ